MFGNRRLQRIRGRHHIVVAYLALFVALGGSAVAAKPLIDGADVQDESLTSADVQNDSLTGDDILESSLGKVASATSADSATTAGDAGTLDGKDSTAFGAPNTAVHWREGSHNIEPLTHGEKRTIGSLELPAGTWLLLAKVNVLARSDNSRLSCRLHWTDDSLTEREIDYAVDDVDWSDGDGTDVLSLTGVESLPKATTVHFTCESSATTLAFQPRFTAVAVDQ